MGNQLHWTGSLYVVNDLPEGNDIGSLVIERSRKEVERRPRSAGEAHANLGIALGNSGLWEGAAAEFERALEIDPQHYVAAINLARLMVEKGDFDGAEPIYKRLLEHYPQTPTPGTQSGSDCYEEAGL